MGFDMLVGTTVSHLSEVSFEPDSKSWATVWIHFFPGPGKSVKDKCYSVFCFLLLKSCEVESG